MEHPFYPIIYLRGFAFSQGLIDDTTADPYMGFNDGSTKFRQLNNGEVSKWFFESPVVRLMKDYDYRDVYDAGQMLPADMEIKGKSIVICRYYEESSTDFSGGKRLPILRYAQELHDLIFQMRERYYKKHDADSPFKVYLVAHSMGGLVVRSFLQNPDIGTAETRNTVDKVFTYATPHNGIDLRLIGNVPGFARMRNFTDFDRTFMEQYLCTEPANSLMDKFDANRFFCLVGTNAQDYEVGKGIVRKAVGPLSDGLVRINNATVYGEFYRNDVYHRVQCPRAYVHRSHSGDYGIVNSEEGYQNLTRFLFGNVRVDGILDVYDITLPPAVKTELDEGKTVEASYHIETAVSIRGSSRGFLHQRVYDHGSAIHRTYDEMVERKALENRRKPHLFSQFLDMKKRENRDEPSLGFRVQLTIRIPEYEVDRKFWRNDRYEGSAIFSDSITLEAVPPDGDHEWRLRYSFESDQSLHAHRYLELENQDGNYFWSIPIVKDSQPGINAKLILKVADWNVDPAEE